MQFLDADLIYSKLIYEDNVVAEFLFFQFFSLMPNSLRCISPVFVNRKHHIVQVQYIFSLPIEIKHKLETCRPSLVYVSHI